MKLDHIAIAVRSIDDAIKFYTQVLGLKLDRIENVPDEKVKAAMIPVGESRIELLEATDEDSTVARFIARRGEGIHHICLEVEDIKRTMNELRGLGVRLIYDEPRRGAAGKLINFIHPSSSHGLLIELAQKGNDRPKG